MSSTERISIVSRGDNIFAIVEESTGNIIKDNIEGEQNAQYEKNALLPLYRELPLPPTGPRPLP
jgi:hypothetical protein